MRMALRRAWDEAARPTIPIARKIAARTSEPRAPARPNVNTLETPHPHETLGFANIDQADHPTNPTPSAVDVARNHRVLQPASKKLPTVISNTMRVQVMPPAMVLGKTRSIAIVVPAGARALSSAKASKIIPSAMAHSCEIELIANERKVGRLADCRLPGDRVIG